MKLINTISFAFFVSYFSISLQAEPSKQEATSSNDLKVIMNGLLDDTKLLTEGIFLEDFSKIKLASNNIANHPKPSSATLNKVKSNLAEEMATFKGFDMQVHNASQEIAKLAPSKDMVKMVSLYHKIIDGCQSCHNQYKSRISNVLSKSDDK